MHRKFFSVLLAFLLIASLLPSAHAASSSISLRPGANSYTVGSTVKVTITVTGDANIGSWQYSLSYNASLLEYQSGADSGGGGAVNFSDSCDGTRSVTQTVTFRALAVGSASLSISNAKIVAFDDLSLMPTGTASCTVNIVASPTLSSVNTLSKLALSAGELSPAFSPNTTAYSVSVPYETASLVIDAPTTDNKARVAVSDTALNVGENTITITVTAQNGARRTYTLRVVREESLLAGSVATVDGKEYAIAFDPEQIPAPEGYEMGTVAYGDKEILVYNAPGGHLTVAYLVNGEGEGAFYRYDQEKNAFFPCVWLTGAAIVVPLPMPEDAAIPDGYEEMDVETPSGVVTFYGDKKNEEAPLYLYAVRWDGELGYFLYDRATGMIFPAEKANEMIGDSVPASADPRDLLELRAELEDAAAAQNRAEIIALLTGLLFVAALIALLILILQRGKKKKIQESNHGLLMAEDAPDPAKAEDDEKRKKETENRN